MLEPGWPVIALGALLATAQPPAAAPPTGYGQVETFQPGKRYNCLPTADHKGWDCHEIGAKPNPVPKSKANVSTEPVPQPTKAPEPATPAQPAQPAATKMTPESPPQEAAPATPPDQAPAAPVETQQSSNLPDYLTNRSTRDQRQAAPEPPGTTAAVQRSNVAPSAETLVEHPSNARASVSTPAEKQIKSARQATKSTQAASQEGKPVMPASPAATHPQPTSAMPAPAEASSTSAASPAAMTIHDEREFLELPAGHFIVELAHAATRAGLDESALSILPHGTAYRVHLRQYGNDEWLLVWGDFTDVDTARAARSELLSSGASVGWPRLIAPLQTEVRRAMNSATP